MCGESTKVPEGRVVGPKPGWEFSLHLHEPCLAAHTHSELGHAALQLLLLFDYLDSAPSTFRVAMAIFKTHAEDLVLLPHLAIKAWKMPSGPAAGYSWRTTIISEGKQNQTDERLTHELHEVFFIKMARTAIHRPTAPEITMTCVELLEKFYFSKDTSRNSYTLLIPLAFTK